MQPQPCRFDTLKKACAEVVRVLGGNKVVGAQMRPGKDHEAASRWMSCCLNPDRNEQFTHNDIAWLRQKGREVGCHAIHIFESEQSGYLPSIPLNQDDLVVLDTYCAVRGKSREAQLDYLFRRWCDYQRQLCVAMRDVIKP
jgi:hypothetical protein